MKDLTKVLACVVLVIVLVVSGSATVLGQEPEMPIQSFTLRINPYGPVFTDGTLNPFHYPEMQAALHKYIDRTYIGQLVGGQERFTTFHPQRTDYERYYSDTHIPTGSSIQYLEQEYDYNEAEGLTWLQAAIAAINADPDVPDAVFYHNDEFLYNGEQVKIVIAARDDDPDDERLQIGQYVASQLETMGFDVEVVAGNMQQILFDLVNVEEEITSGGWNIYTGGWMTFAGLDETHMFAYFHTDHWPQAIPAFAHLNVPSELEDAAQSLLNGTGARDDLVAQALPLHMKYGMFYLTSWGTTPVETATGSGTAHIGVSRGTIEDLAALPVPSNPPDGYTFPHGLFSFRITDLDYEGQTVTVTVYLPEEVPENTKWWKYHDGQWRDYNIPITISGKTITITLTDGALEDADGLANGEITDPGCPGFVLSLGYTVGWETQPINKVAVMAPWIGLLAAIAGASLLVLRRRQTQN